MRKLLPALIIGLCLAVVLPACGGRAPAPQTAYIYTDFSAGDPGGETGGAVSRYEIRYNGDLTPALLAGELTGLTGLDFSFTADVSPGAIRVDWGNGSTLLGGLGGLTQKDDFHFADAASMNWFMLDSLYRSLRANFADCDVYFTMLGGNPLIAPGAGEIFPVDAPYMGSVYYVSGAGDAGNPGDPGDPGDSGGLSGTGEFNRYFDRENNLTFSYPSEFSLDGRLNPVTERMEFTSRREDALLGFWVDSNENSETLQEFVDRVSRSDTQSRRLSGRENPWVILLAETVLSPAGKPRGQAYQFAVWPERVVNICVNCSPDRLDYWYDLMEEFSVKDGPP
ncbi:MAG: hypothetical protein LBK56_05670 [Gracilibacteraceae bacterium]|jgi:hypothetical protein|nr:hypothetical protein [Gracilibacteraceae bacterium]